MPGRKRGWCYEKAEQWIFAGGSGLTGLSGVLFCTVSDYLLVFRFFWGSEKPEFVGLVNYQELFENEMFLLAVKNTCRYMLVTVPVTLGAAVGLSVVLRHVGRGVTFLRLSFYIR